MPPKQTWNNLKNKQRIFRFVNYICRPLFCCCCSTAQLSNRGNMFTFLTAASAAQGIQWEKQVGNTDFN